MQRTVPKGPRPVTRLEVWVGNCLTILAVFVAAALVAVKL